MASVVGRPPTKGSFQKGDDSRRNRNGQRNKEAVAFARSLRELIVTEGEKRHKVVDADGKELFKGKKIELVVRNLYSKAMAGEAWAVQFIAERVEGKTPDRSEITGKDGGAIETRDTSLSNEERVGRLIELLDAARARRDGQSNTGK